MTDLTANSLTRLAGDRTTLRAHLVGACGAGMASLAELLTDDGWTVSGSDSSPPAGTHALLQKRGVTLATGHAATNVPAGTRLVVHSPAIGPDNPELQAAMADGIPCLTYPKMLGRLMQDRRGISVCGTHGKSTTTALIAWILAESGLSPSVLMGARLLNPPRSGWAGRGDLLLTESCEYRGGFLYQHPEMLVLLGLEPDHFDCFPTTDEMTAVFRRLTTQLQPGGILFANADCPSASAIARDVSERVTWFSRSGILGWRAEDVCAVETGLLLRVCHGAHVHSQIAAPLYGRHHVMNLLAAVAVAAELGVPAADIERAVSTFPGLQRRFEQYGIHGGVAVIDDYAHHPSAVTATLRAVRHRYPGRRIVAVFEPHQVSRTERLLGDFALALSQAGRVLLAPIFPARETPTLETCEQLSRSLATAVGAKGTPCHAVASLDRLLATLDDALQSGDVLLTMGAGIIDRIPHEFTGRFQRHSEAG